MKAHHPIVMCRVAAGGLGKVRYSSRKQALNAMNVLRRPASPTRSVPVRVYRCEHCAGWHLTSREAAA